MDDEVVMTVMDDVLRVDWCNIGEGYNGDFDPDDPEDANLLRFDVSVKCVDGWEPVVDGSACTCVPADTPEDVLKRLLQHIFNSYREVIHGCEYPSVSRITDKLSYLAGEITESGE